MSPLNIIITPIRSNRQRGFCLLLRLERFKISDIVHAICAFTWRFLNQPALIFVSDGQDMIHNVFLLRLA
jgi:hypothetical protein